MQKATDTTTFTNCASAPAAWRPRSFVYDSLSRLTSATNPESGTITYGYDANGNLKTRTASAPNQSGSATVTTTKNYDALNRLTGESYSDGTTPTNFYDYDVAAPWMTSAKNIVGRLANSSNQYFVNQWVTRNARECSGTRLRGFGAPSKTTGPTVGPTTGGLAP